MAEAFKRQLLCTTIFLSIFLAIMLGEVVWSWVRGMNILENFYASDLIGKVVELNSSLDNQLSATGYTAEIESIRAEL